MWSARRLQNPIRSDSRLRQRSGMSLEEIAQITETAVLRA